VTAEDEQPIFLIIAGPNGSGKSSAYKDAEVEAVGRTVWIINPDILTARILKIEGLGQNEANLEAVKRIESWLDASIQAHQSVGVETVLSTDKYRRLVTAAKRHRFEIHLIYVLLKTPQLNIERVKLRVQKGGHDVPEDKIVSRWYKSLEQLPWFLQQADKASLYDNSGAEPKLIGKKEGDTIELDPDVLAEIEKAVKTIQTE
jgi:predicted ABC-type ATPase